MSTFRQTCHVFYALVVHEVADLVASFRFRVTAFLVVTLMLVSAVLYASRYRSEREAHENALRLHDAALSGRTVAGLASMSHPAFKPPWKLAFLADGEQSQGLDIYRQTLTPWELPELETRSPTRDRWRESEPLDWLFVSRAVLSLAAFVLGYDAICGRRQHRRLLLILSYAHSRAKVLTAKLAALWACLVAPFLAGTLVGLLAFALTGGVRFQGGELVKIGLAVLLSLVSAVLFSLMALLVSVLSQVAVNSLVMAALLWVTTVAVAPAAAGLAAQLLRPIPSEQEVIRRVQEARRQAAWRPKEVAALDGYALERRSAELEMERFERQEALRRDLVDQRIAQVVLARNLAALSPMALLHDLTERLLGTGPYRDRRFLEQAWAFREVLAAHVEELDRGDPESPHLHFFPDYLSNRPVASEAVPRFFFAETSLREGVREAFGRLRALAIWTAALTVLAYAAFERWDPRRVPRRTR